MGASRKSKVEIKWSPEFAYALGLIASDGNLSPDGRHIEITSKDIAQLITFRNSLKIQNRIGYKTSGFAETKIARLQFGDVNFYSFLLGIGLTPNKSKNLGKLNILEKFFPDFLRGCIDGDGSIDTFRHPESKHPQFRIRICSASPKFLSWLKRAIKSNVGTKGGWISRGQRAYFLSYGKDDAIRISKLIYYNKSLPFLKRKYLVARHFI